MKRINILLLLLATAILVTTVQAQTPQYETVTTMAEDVNCRAACHSTDPHVIHEKVGVQCTQCHGATLTDRQPQCSKCHTGSIHNVHIAKVRTEDCSYCHSGLESIHIDMMSDTLCSHCHKNLLVVHGGPTESCNKCHGTVPDIVVPASVEGNTVVCQNCHLADDVAAIHGEPDDLSSCYRCHRPGSSEIEASSEIPHFLHIPDVDCNRCHLDQDTGKIYIPVCNQCHSVEKIHGYSAIGLKTSSSGLKCAVCHPMSAEATETKTEVAAATDTSEPADTEAVGDYVSDIPGFGILTVLTCLGVLYVIGRKR